MMRVNNALRDFDNAPIFTIHGFCSRLLADYAFESGNLFRFSMASQTKNAVLQLCDNYYRSVFYNESLCDVRRILQKELK